MSEFALKKWPTFLSDKIWLTSESNGILVYFLEWGGCEMTQNRKKFPIWVNGASSKSDFGKNVISQDSPGIVEKKNKWREKIERGVLKSET